MALLEFLSPTERRPIMLTKANEKIPMASATSVRVKPKRPECGDGRKNTGARHEGGELGTSSVRGDWKLLRDMASEVNSPASLE